MIFQPQPFYGSDTKSDPSRVVSISMWLLALDMSKQLLSPTQTSTLLLKHGWLAPSKTSTGICPGLRQPRHPTGLPDMWQHTQENETWLVTLLSCFSVLVCGQFRKVSRWINVSAFILYVVLYKKIKLQSYDRLLKKHANSWLAFSKTHFLPGIQLKKENYCISNALYFRIS